MNNKKASSIRSSFWTIGAVMLIWHVMGCVNYFVQMNPEMLAYYRESERIIVENRPAWATAAFAVAVFGGAVGCVLLLVRRSAAFYIFIVSLIGAVFTSIHTLSAGVELGAGEMMGIVALPLAVAVFLVWYAKYAERKNWIG